MIEPAATTHAAYLSGFGNEHATEALAGALPVGRNSPQRAPLGLYAEQLSGTAFTAPRAHNRRTWVYRIRPSANHRPFIATERGLVRTAPNAEIAAPPNRLRWNPFALSAGAPPTDFVHGLRTLATAGDAALQTGCAVHVYAINASMQGAFYDADGELLIVPQQGRLRIVTELGIIRLDPGAVAVIPRGIRFRVELLDDGARGYVCENYGAAFRLPDLGPIGANGLANPRDFLTPVAWFEDRDAPTDLVAKFGGELWTTQLDHSPFDVVGWHGNYAPYTYDLARFNTINSVSFDHPDPSIFTVLTSPSEIAGTANVDFVIFPPRWLVSENTFRPPWFHRNVMNEFMGLIRGVYDAKAEGFAPGGASLHNATTAHGPDVASFVQATETELQPRYLAETLAFMFEARLLMRPTRYALECPELQDDYDACWSGFPKSFRER